MSKVKQPERHDVTLLKPHTHQGIEHQPGDTISVNAVEKEWLVQQNVIAASAADKKRGE